MKTLLMAHGYFNFARGLIGAVLIYYLIQQGISPATIAIAKSCQLIISVLFNYAAGKIAERFGNKTSILLSCVFSIIYLLLMLKPTEYSVIIGEMFNGLSIAFYVGAYEAWLFQFKNHQENHFTLIARSAEMIFITLILSSVVGGYLYDNSLYMAIIVMIIALIGYQRVKEQTRHPAAERVLNFSQSLRYFIQHTRMNVIFYIALAGMMQLLYQLWPLFFTDNLHFSQTQLGYILAAMMISQWLFTFVSRKLALNNRKNSIASSLIGIAIFSTTTLLSAFYMENQYISLLLFLCFISLCALTQHFLFANIAAVFDTHYQSTMISLIDAISRSVGALLLAIYALVKHNDVVYIWSLFPIYAFIALIYLFRVKN